MDLLKDPAGDRSVKTLKPPPHRPLDRKLIFPEKLKGEEMIFTCFRKTRLEIIEGPFVEGRQNH